MYFVLWIMLVPSTTHSFMLETKYKGIDQLFESKTPWSIYPIQGYFLIQSGALKNIYEYPHSVEIEKLFHFLFESSDSMSPGHSIYPNQIIKKLKPETLGKILSLMNQDLSENKNFDEVKKRIIELVKKNLSEKDFKNSSLLLNQFLLQFSENLLKAILYVRSEHSFYPSDFIHQVLFSLFWYLSKNDKKEFIHLFYQVDDILNKKEQFFNNLSQELKAWNLEEYTEDSFYEFIKKYDSIKKEKKIDYLKLNIDEIIFYLMIDDFWGDESQLKFLSSARENDCKQNSIRNFFNIVFHDPNFKGFNIKDFRLNEKNSKFKIKTEIFPHLVKFYENNKRLVGLESDFLRQNWQSEVLNIQIDNKGNSKSIETKNSLSEWSKKGMFETLEIMNKFLFRSSKNFEKLSLNEKWDHICNALSRHDKKPIFILDWKMKNSSVLEDKRDIVSKNVNDLILEFSVNNKPSFYWNFNKKCFSIEKIHNKFSNFKTEILKQILSEYAGSFIEDTHFYQSTLSNLVQEDNFDEIVNKLSNHSETSHLNVNYLFYFLPLSSNQSKMKAIKFLFSKNEDALPILKKLINELPSDDPIIQSQVLKYLLSSPMMTIQPYSKLFFEFQNEVQSKVYDVLSKTESERTFNWEEILGSNSHQKIDYLITDLKWTTDAQGKIPLHSILLKGEEEEKVDIINQLDDSDLKKTLISYYIYGVGGESKLNLLSHLKNKISPAFIQSILNKVGPEIFLNEKKQLDKNALLIDYLESSELETIKIIENHFSDKKMSHIIKQAILFPNIKGSNLIHIEMAKENSSKLEWIQSYFTKDEWRVEILKPDNHGKTPIHYALLKSYSDSIDQKKLDRKKYLLSDLSQEDLNILLISSYEYFGLAGNGRSTLLESLVMNNNLDLVRMALGHINSEILLNFFKKSSIYDLTKVIQYVDPILLEKMILSKYKSYENLIKELEKSENLNNQERVYFLKNNLNFKILKNSKTK